MMKRAFRIVVVILIGIFSLAHAESESFPYKDVVDAMIAKNNACYADMEDENKRNLLTIEYDEEDTGTYTSEYSMDFFDDESLMLFSFMTDYKVADGIEEIQIYMDDDQNEIALGNISGFLSVHMPDEAAREASLSDARELVDQICNSGKMTGGSVELAQGITFHYEKMDETGGYMSLQYQTPLTMELISDSSALAASEESTDSSDDENPFAGISLGYGNIIAGGYDLSQLQTPFDFTYEEFNDTVGYMNQNLLDLDSCIGWSGETLEDGFYTRRWFINDWPAIHAVIGPDGYVYALSISCIDVLDSDYGTTTEKAGTALSYLITAAVAAGGDNMLSDLVETVLSYDTEYSEYVENNPLSDFDSYDLSDLLGDGISHSGSMYDDMLTMRVQLAKVNDDMAIYVDYLYTPEEYSFNH